MRHRTVLLLITVLAGVISACGHFAAPGVDSQGHTTDAGMARVTAALRHYEAYLRFEATPDRTTAAQHESLVVTYRLLNTYSEPIAACIGVSNHYTFFGPAGVAQRLGPVVDHPYCVRPFNLEPHDTLVWTDTATVLPAGPGKTRFFAHLHIVHPKDCDIYGCYDIHLKSTPVEITLLPPQQ